MKRSPRYIIFHQFNTASFRIETPLKVRCILKPATVITGSMLPFSEVLNIQGETKVGLQF